MIISCLSCLQSGVRRSTHARFLHHSLEAALLRLLFPVITAILLIDVILLGTNDTDIITADASIYEIELTNA